MGPRFARERYRRHSHARGRRLRCVCSTAERLTRRELNRRCGRPPCLPARNAKRKTHRQAQGLPLPHHPPLSLIVLTPRPAMNRRTFIFQTSGLVLTACLLPSFSFAASNDPLARVGMGTVLFRNRFKQTKP